MARDALRTLRAEIESDLDDLNAVQTEVQATASQISSTGSSSRDKAALGAFLHSFYNGVENVLKRLAQEMDGGVPVGEGWHRALLRRMETPVEGVRPAVLDPNTVERLEPYLGFRHFFRHAYTFEIDWDKLRPLITDIEETLTSFHRDIDRFFDEQLNTGD